MEMTIGSQSDDGNETEFVGSPQDWIDVFRITQGREIWQEHGDWITRHGALSSFGPGIKERFQVRCYVMLRNNYGCESSGAHL